MARLHRGDTAVLDVLIDRHGGRVRTYLGHVVRDPSWAEDLTQETFVRVLERAGEYDPAWPLAVWLLRISRNLAIDLMRRERARRLALIRWRAADWRASSAPSAMQHAERDELALRLDAAVGQLAEPFRSAFVLREVEQLSYEAIAAIMDTTVKTVSTRLHRARRQLRKRLRALIDPDEFERRGKR